MAGLPGRRPAYSTSPCSRRPWRPWQRVYPAEKGSLLQACAWASASGTCYLYAWAISLLLVLGVYGLAWLGGYARLDLRLERLLALGPGSNIANFQVPAGFSEQ